MLRPSLSFMEDDFKLGKKMANSAHAARKVKFADIDGQIKTGYFKPCDPNNYPILLAKYVVAFSVFIRTALGTRAAEERLVYNDKGIIVGTVSLQVPDFVPLLTQADDNYPNPLHQKWGNPDKQTLLDKDVASLLVSAYKHKNDDLHPANFSVNGLIDFDEYYIELTSILKGERLTSGWLSNSPKVVSDLKENDLKIFPNITARTHWPTNAYPKNLNLNKNYRTDAFSKLQNDPEFIHQYLLALLKELLAYDEKMIEDRLRLYFGSEDLDLQALSAEKRKALFKFGIRDKLFDGIEDKPYAFIKHVMRFYRAEHQKFEDMVLHMPEFQAFLISLNKKPIEFFQLKTWFLENNKYNTAAPYNLSHIEHRYQYLLRECFKLPFDQQLQSLQSTILLSRISSSKDISSGDQKECKFCDIDIMSQNLLKLQQKKISSDVTYLSNTVSKPQETKQLTNAILNQMHKIANDLYEQIKARKERYLQKSNLNINDNHEFINDMEAILKNAESVRANYKKWLLETGEKLNQIEDLSTYIHPLIKEMEMLFRDLDNFTQTFKSEILAPLRISDSLIYMPQPIGSFAPKNPETKLIPAPMPSTNPIICRVEPEDDHETPVSIPDEISRLLKIWTSAANQSKENPDLSEARKSQIKSAIVEARKKYDTKNSGLLRWTYSFYQQPRDRQDDELPLEDIFAKRGWCSNSLNTYILQNVCVMMLEDYNKSYYLKDTDDKWWGMHAKEIAQKSGLKKDSKTPQMDKDTEAEMEFKTLSA